MMKTIKSIFIILSLLISYSYGENNSIIVTNEKKIIEYYKKGKELAEQGDYKNSLKPLKKSLFLQDKSKNNRYLILILNRMAISYRELYQYDKALKYLIKAEKFMVKVRGKEHSDMADIYNNIALIYHAKGDYDKALKLYNKALKIYLKLNNGLNFGVATTSVNIGLILEEKEAYQDALAFYKKGLKIRTKISSGKDPLLAMNHTYIAAIYVTFGQKYEARKHYEKAFKIALDIFGKKHIQTLIISTQLATTYDYEESLKVHTRNLETVKKYFGKNMLLVSIYQKIGLLWESKYNYKKALTFYKEALNIEKSLLGENHPSLAHSYKYIAIVYDKRKNRKEALIYYKKSFKLYSGYMNKKSKTINFIKEKIQSLEEKGIEDYMD